MSLKKDFIVLLLLFFEIIAQGQVKNNKPVRVLIVDGYSNHDWKQTSVMTKKILEESKLFEVTITTAPATTHEDSLAAWDPDFSRYDVVIQNTNNIHNRALHWPRKAEEKLERYVAAGGGLYILHSANNAFPHWKEYDLMMGLGWRPKETGAALEIGDNKNIIHIPQGEGMNTGHGKRFDALIHVLNRHAINHDFPAQWRTASMELYTYARGPAKNITVLSYAFDTATNKNWPVDWVVKYGKGRVYNSSMGHLWKDEIYPVSYRCIGFQTLMIRAVEWLAKRKITYPLPVKFPNNTISVRDEYGQVKVNANGKFFNYKGIMHQYISNSRLWIVPNGGHLPYLNPDNQSEFLKVSLEFLNGKWDKKE